MTATKAPSNQAKIDALLQDGLYRKDKVSILEQYVKEQIEEQSYDGRANKILMKLYLMFPAAIDEDIVLLMLLKALLDVSPAFHHLLHILPERFHAESGPVSILRSAGQFLETAHYNHLWTTINENGAIFNKIPGWKDQIRRVILALQAATYQSESRAMLSEAVGLDGNELDKLLNDSKSVARVEGGTVYFALTPDNVPRTKKTKQSLDLNSVMSVLRLQ